MDIQRAVLMLRDGFIVNANVSLCELQTKCLKFLVSSAEIHIEQEYNNIEMIQNVRFCGWLQGFLDGIGSETVSSEQLIVIRQRLDDLISGNGNSHSSVNLKIISNENSNLNIVNKMDSSEADLKKLPKGSVVFSPKMSDVNIDPFSDDLFDDKPSCSNRLDLGSKELQEELAELNFNSGSLYGISVGLEKKRQRGKNKKNFWFW